MADDLFKSLDIPPVRGEEGDASYAASVGTPTNVTERALSDLANAQHTQNRHLQAIAGSVGFIAVILAIFLALAVLGFLASIIIAVKGDDSSPGSRFGAITAMR
ncbi:MAG: hypothetical protein JWN72_1444 [Thermoleophilia bacterium]|nr:hypothetical protein [Thermoleophilia bacterium]